MPVRHTAEGGMSDMMQSNRVKGWGIAIGVGVAALALVDFVALRGDTVDTATVYLRSSDPAVIEITRVGEEHLVEISTRRSVQGESKGKAIKYRLEGPDGTVWYEDAEIVSRKSRYFEVVPVEAGSYTLYAEENMNLLGSGSGTAYVRVYVNDRRILGRFFNF
jgi:hypothetical protein